MHSQTKIMNETPQTLAKAIELAETPATPAVAPAPVTVIKKQKLGVKRKVEGPRVYSCDTQNIKATLTFPAAEAHKSASLTIALPDGNGNLCFNGQAAKSLYTLFKQVYA